MFDRQSALPGAVFDGAVRVEEAGLRGMVTLKGDLSDRTLQSVVRKVTGVAVPDTRGVEISGENGVCWMAPDELILLCAHDRADQIVADVTAGLQGTHSLAVNVSDARAVFRIEGSGVREVLAKLTPADLHPGSFGPGEIRRTRLAQVPAAFWMTGPESFDLVCFRSVAEYVFDLLSTAAGINAQVDFF